CWYWPLAFFFSTRTESVVGGLCILVAECLTVTLTVDPNRTRLVTARSRGSTSGSPPWPFLPGGSAAQVAPRDMASATLANNEKRPMRRPGRRHVKGTQNALDIG